MSNACYMKPVRVLFLSFNLLVATIVATQPPHGYKWTKDGKGYYKSENGQIIRTDLSSLNETLIADETKLTPAGQRNAITIRNFFFTGDERKILIYTNSKKVWRYDTRGD